jgi:queuine tRNA-ribosyltransferase
VTFRDHLQGDKHLFSPELAIRIQEVIGADIMMAFDECPELPATQAYLEASLARTTRWAARCLEARTRPDCALFGITQGGVDLALRRRHIEEMAPLPFDGFAHRGFERRARPSRRCTRRWRRWRRCCRRTGRGT